MSESTFEIYVQKVKQFFNTDGCSLLYYAYKGLISFKNFVIEAHEWVKRNSISVIQSLYYSISDKIRQLWDMCENIMIYINNNIKKVDEYFRLKETMLINIYKVEFLKKIGDAIKKKMTEGKTAAADDFNPMYEKLQKSEKLNLKACMNTFAQKCKEMGIKTSEITYNNNVEKKIGDWFQSHVGNIKNNKTCYV